VKYELEFYIQEDDILNIDRRGNEILGLGTANPLRDNKTAVEVSTSLQRPFPLPGLVANLALLMTDL
jgi:hypothetical protein